MLQRAVLAYNEMMSDEERWMREAIDCARKALEMEEVPIGCVMVHLPSGNIIGRGFNQRESQNDPTAHAEILAMRQAGHALKHWRLLGCGVGGGAGAGPGGGGGGGNAGLS